MKNPASFFRKFGLPILAFLASFLLFKIALAAGDVNVGIAPVDSSIILSNSSPIVIIGRIIQVLLGLLSVIAISIVIYAGYLWMTSMGSEDKIKEAQRLLKNATIGIIIILSAWGIVLFVLSKLVGVTTGNISSDQTTNNFKNLSLGALGSCSVETVYPQPGSKEVARNTSILITVKEPLQLDTVCINKNTKAACACDNTSNCNLINPKNIQIYKTSDGNSCVSGNCSTNVSDVEVSVPTGNKTLVLRPLSYLGNSSGNVEYGVHLTNDIKKNGGQALFSTCSSDFLEWIFETSSNLDLEPPQVLASGIFPPVDSAADTISSNSVAKAAQAQIVVTGCPQTYLPARLISVQKTGNSSDAAVTVDPNYSGAITNFTIDLSESVNKMRLFSGSNLLGASDVVNNQATFTGYFTVSITKATQGDSWNVVVSPAQAAENLSVGSNSYIFVSTKTNSGNEILVPSSCSPAEMAANISIALSGNSDVVTTASGGTLTLFAKTAGVAGNSLTLSSNGQGLFLQKFAGGAEKSDTYTIVGLQDKPMNSIIQVNFNEAVNPMTLSGSADEVKSYIQLVNANKVARTSGQACSLNSDCLSYNCQASACVGNYVGGKFVLSNVYKTLEFISDKECGVNSCGEIMYCLPASSHLSLKINAATLKACSTSSDCQAFAPYSTCTSGICRDTANNVNYPMADTLNLNGVVDLAFNSLDGNRDKKADGPVLTVYPYFVEGEANLDKRDGFEFSFFISNQINSTPPTISLTSPRLLETGVRVTNPVVIDFNDLMMNSTLRTGSADINNGLVNANHKLLNLRSSSNNPLGYWIESDNKERGVPNGEPDYTSSRIMHSDFFESVTYVSQIGSGVKNIYQNCFKPSVGPACLSLSESNPSCCFGSPTNALDSNGNCVN
ncbi:MAG: hypothetical protein WCK59_04790 [Candidatus Falkowbacteria bacterium]